MERLLQTTLTAVDPDVDSNSYAVVTDCEDGLRRLAEIQFGYDTTLALAYLAGLSELPED